MQRSKHKLLKEPLWIVLSFGITLIPILLLWFVYGSSIEITHHDTYLLIPLSSLFLLIFFIVSFIINIIRVVKMKFSSIPFLFVFSIQFLLVIGVIILAINQ